MPDGTSFERFDALDPIRVMLLLPSLHGGGAERVAVNLANRCDPRLFDVKIGLLRRAGPYLADLDPERVVTPGDGADWLRDEGRNADQYKPSAILASALRGPRGVADMVRAHRPEVVMSFLKGMSIATKFGLHEIKDGRPVWIAREGNNTDVVIDDELPNPAGRWVMKRLIRHVYRGADCFLANSSDMAETLTPTLGLDPARVRVIHNPIDVGRVSTLAKAPLPEAPARPFIVTAGRLAYQKGHDVLLKAFAASEAAKGHALVIIGQGALEAELKALAAGLRVADRVHFPGFVTNPWAWFSKASLFVLASRWEGCPNAVGEALACGATTLITDCAFGPRELVEHGRSGWVVEKDSVEALRAGLDTLLFNPELSARLAARARPRALQFNLDRMVGEYSRLFLEQAGREPTFVPMAMAAE